MINPLAIFFMILATLLGACGALYLKKGSIQEWRILFTNRNLIIGVLFYGVSGIFYLSALNIEQLSIVYPFVSLTYVWTVMLSVKYLQERMNLWKYIGLVLILIGVVVIGRGSF